MKNVYTSLLMGSALLLAVSSMAQSKSGQPRPEGFHSVHPISHHVSGAAQRGGGAPVNDDCTGAVAVGITADGSPHTFSGDNTGATEDGGTGYIMVWEAFTTTECSDITINYCVPGSEFTNFLVNLAIQCPDFLTGVLTGASDACTLSFEGLPAGTYYIPVMVEDGSTPIGAYSIQVSATACPAPPSNDECAGAISLTSGTSCNLTYANTIGATASMDPINCNGAGLSPTSKDVWFSFVCTSTEQSIGMIGFNAFDGVVELFSGSCGNLTSLGCADNTFPASADESTTEVLDQTGLAVGSTYYFRIYDWGESSATHDFAACVTEGSNNNVGIAEQHEATTLSIYPNPGSGDFNLQYVGANGLGTIEVLDLTGRTVYSETAQLSSGSTHSLNLSKLAQGQYSLRLTVNGTRSQQNLMVR